MRRAIVLMVLDHTNVDYSFFMYFDLDTTSAKTLELVRDLNGRCSDDDGMEWLTEEFELEEGEEDDEENGAMEKWNRLAATPGSGVIKCKAGEMPPGCVVVEMSFFDWST